MKYTFMCETRHTNFGTQLNRLSSKNAEFILIAQKLAQIMLMISMHIKFTFTLRR
jgi:hypothetical protein